MCYRIGLIYDKPLATVRNTVEASSSDKQREDTKIQITNVLKHKYDIVEVIADDNIIDNLTKSKIDIAFPLCTGIRGESRQAQVPAILEMLGIPYVGSGILSHALALNKSMAKQVLLANGIVTPVFQVFFTGDEKMDIKNNYPLIVKPACEGSGFGIHKDSVVYDEKSLYSMINKVLKEYGPPVLVEEFIEGREITVGIIGNGLNKNVLPIMEIDFGDVPEEFGKFYTYEVKTYCGKETKYICPALLDRDQMSIIENEVKLAYDALGCRDLARVDIRFSDNKAYILEINSLPGLKSVYSDLPKMAESAGMTYDNLILLIVETALERMSMIEGIEEYDKSNILIS